MRYLHILAMGAVLSATMLHDPKVMAADDPSTDQGDDDAKRGSKSANPPPAAGDAPIGSHRDDVVPPEGGFQTDDATRSRGMEHRDPGDVDVGR